jgi:hypothetical protein
LFQNFVSFIEHDPSNIRICKPLLKAVFIGNYSNASHPPHNAEVLVCLARPSGFRPCIIDGEGVNLNMETLMFVFNVVFNSAVSS